MGHVCSVPSSAPGRSHRYGFVSIMKGTVYRPMLGIVHHEGLTQEQMVGNPVIRSQGTIALGRVCHVGSQAAGGGVFLPRQGEL